MKLNTNKWFKTTSALSRLHVLADLRHIMKYLTASIFLVLRDPMKVLGFILIFIFSQPVIAESLCFSPVKEKKGDKSTDRSWWQGFNYKVQVDDGPVITPSSENSTLYEYVTKSPMVKIWLGS